MRNTRRTLGGVGLLLATAALLGACGDDGPTGPAQLTPQQVQGIYQLCSLRFTPTNAQLRQVAIDSAAVQPRSGSGSSAQLGLNQDRSFELEYFPRGFNTDTELPGTYSLGANTVTLTFNNAATAGANLLLPREVRLAYGSSDRSLTVVSQGEYTVPRSRYSQLSGVSEAGLAEQIPGTLSGRFVPSQGSCG